MEQFASHPEVRVTLRGSDGSIIATRSVSSAGIPPRGQIAFCENVYFDERPASVQIQPLSAGYETALFAPSAFKDFKVINLKLREGTLARVTGELLNPYPADTGAYESHALTSTSTPITKAARRTLERRCQKQII